MANPRDYYEVLGVSKDADLETIKRAYKKLAIQYHPDRNPNDKAAEEKFKEAAGAYEVLSDPQKRAQYDQFGHAAFGGGGRGPGGGGGFSAHTFTDVEDIFSHFGDIFSDMFGQSGAGGGFSRGGRRGETGSGGRGRGGRDSSSRRGADLRYMLEISLKDVIQGCERDIEYDAEVQCSSCHGTGAEKGSSPQTCPTCGGRGQVVHQQGFFSMATTCHHCRGQGTVIKNPCQTCRGQGRVPDHHKIRVTVPPGVDTGTRLRVAGEGEGGFGGGGSGDLYVEVVVGGHRDFERHGADLLGGVTLDYLQLILGGRIQIDTVTGSKVIEVPKGSQVGDRIRVSGEGVPTLRGSRRGDLYLTIHVQFPTKISKAEERLLRELATARGVDLEGHSKPSFWSRKKGT